MGDIEFTKAGMWTRVVWCCFALVRMVQQALLFDPL